MFDYLPNVVTTLVGQRTDPATDALGAVQTLSLACEQVLGAVSAPRAKLDFGSENGEFSTGLTLLLKYCAVRDGPTMEGLGGSSEGSVAAGWSTGKR